MYSQYTESDYFVIYDLQDNIVAYCDDLDELSRFTNRLKKYLKFHFKTKDTYQIQIPKYLKIYKFSD